MPTFRLFQKSLTEDQRLRLNGPDGGWGSEPAFSAYANLGMGTIGSRKADALVVAAADLGLFRHTADIRADRVEQVFEIGNIGPEENISRHTPHPMYSVSVGDVVVDMDTGTAWFCDNFGWVELFEDTLMAINMNTKSFPATVEPADNGDDAYDMIHGYGGFQGKTTIDNVWG